MTDRSSVPRTPLLGRVTEVPFFAMKPSLSAIALLIVVLTLSSCARGGTKGALPVFPRTEPLVTDVRVDQDGVEGALPCGMRGVGTRAPVAAFSLAESFERLSVSAVTFDTRGSLGVAVRGPDGELRCSGRQGPRAEVIGPFVAGTHEVYVLAAMAGQEATVTVSTQSLDEQRAAEIVARGEEARQLSASRHASAEAQLARDLAEEHRQVASEQVELREGPIFETRTRATTCYYLVVRLADGAVYSDRDFRLRIRFESRRELESEPIPGAVEGDGDRLFVNRESCWVGAGRASVVIESAVRDAPISGGATVEVWARSTTAGEIREEEEASVRRSTRHWCDYCLDQMQECMARRRASICRDNYRGCQIENHVTCP